MLPVMARKVVNENTTLVYICNFVISASIFRSNLYHACSMHLLFSLNRFCRVSNKDFVNMVFIVNSSHRFSGAAVACETFD